MKDTKKKVNETDVTIQSVSMWIEPLTFPPVPGKLWRREVSRLSTYNIQYGTNVFMINTSVGEGF